MQRQAAHRTSLLQRGVMRWIWPPLLGCMLALILFGATLLGLASRASSEEGVASWYGGRHHGRPTASGAVVSGAGGSGLLGGGGRSETAAGTVGTAGTGYGAGAGGSTATNNTATNVAGQAGQAGAVVIEKHFLRAP